MVFGNCFNNNMLPIVVGRYPNITTDNGKFTKCDDSHKVIAYMSC